MLSSSHSSLVVWPDSTNVLCVMLIRVVLVLKLSQHVKSGASI